jgi:hypothetical protein
MNRFALPAAVVALVAVAGLPAEMPAAVPAAQRLAGDRLTLTTAPSRDPATGKPSVRTVVWERVRSP